MVYDPYINYLKTLCFIVLFIDFIEIKKTFTIYQILEGIFVPNCTPYILKIIHPPKRVEIYDFERKMQCYVITLSDPSVKCFHSAGNCEKK